MIPILAKGKLGKGEIYRYSNYKARQMLTRLKRIPSNYIGIFRAERIEYIIYRILDCKFNIALDGKYLVLITSIPVKYLIN